MSFIKKLLIPIGLLVLVAISGCLLWDISHQTAVLATTKSEKSLRTASAIQANSNQKAIYIASSTTSALPEIDGISFEIVTTDAQQERGLGGRAVIPSNYAMLFVFPRDDTYGFWMKDMLAPIDMVWLSDNGTIVKIDGSVAANTYPDVFYPPQPIRYVLETKAGFSKQEGWHVGTKVQLPLAYLPTEKYVF